MRSTVTFPVRSGRSVATSDVTRRIGGWFTSNPNLWGLAAAILALGAHVVFGLGAMWGLALVGAYGIGSLIAPRSKVDLHVALATGEGLSAEQLTQQLNRLRALTAPGGRKLDPDVTGKLDQALDALESILARWSDVTQSKERAHTVELIVVDYLPNSLQAYLNLPRTYAITSRVAGQRTAHDELVEQLGILAEESERIRAAVYARDLNTISDQSRFLRTKFSKSGLDL